MRHIPLRGSYGVGRYAFVDDWHYCELMKYKWYLCSDGRICGHVRVDGIVVTVRMHRFIMRTPKGLVVDHIDGNQFNNQECNLRNCTQLQNSWNHRKTKTYRGGKCSSQYIGVYWSKKNKKWVAEIAWQGKMYNLGLFDNEEKAAQMYDMKAAEFFNEFANLNFKDTG